MTNLILDAYVIFWKHFERQNSEDEDFLTRATCVLCVFIGALNVLQIASYALGGNLGILKSSSKLTPWIVAVIVLAIGVRGMKIFVARHPAVQGRAKIEERYDQISQSRETAIVLLAFANIVAFLLLSLLKSK